MFFFCWKSVFYLFASILCNMYVFMCIECLFVFVNFVISILNFKKKKTFFFFFFWDSLILILLQISVIFFLKINLKNLIPTQW
jgi:hypothetical protein